MDPFRTKYKRHQTELGWAAGTGSEFKINDNWLFRVEYLHYDFGNRTTRLQDGRLTVDVVRAGLSLRFGDGPIAALLPCNLRYPPVVSCGL